MEKLKIFAKTVEEEALKQIDEMSNCDAYKDCFVRIMPDVHAGKGCTIGTVIKLNDKVVPNTVGVDIGCGMLVVLLNENVNILRLDEVINKYVPSGFSIHDNPVRMFGELENLRCKEVIDLDMANRSIGSLGGGNHFIELNESGDGTKFLVIHSGSRNLGVRICKYYQDLAISQCSDTSKKVKDVIERLKNEGRTQDIQSELAKAKNNFVNKELAYLTGKDMEDYIHDMCIAQKYAEINRQTIAKIICERMGLGLEHHAFTTIHNYIDTDTMTLRKGAVRADKGELLIIPMNMRDGSLICSGKGNLDWLYSAPHGAGRLMSRSEAKKNLSMDDFKKEMSAIYSTSICEETIDESPMAYKPMQEIIDCINDTVDVLHVIKPIYNFKAKGR